MVYSDTVHSRLEDLVNSERVRPVSRAITSSDISTVLSTTSSATSSVIQAIQAVNYCCVFAVFFQWKAIEIQVGNTCIRAKRPQDLKCLSLSYLAKAEN